MIDVLRIAHLRIAPQEGNLEVNINASMQCFSNVILRNMLAVQYKDK